MGIQVDQLPHSCGTRKGLKVFLQEDGSIDGFCFRCAQRVAHPYGKDVKLENIPKRPQKTQEEVQEEIHEVFNYQTVDVAKRKLRASTLEKFGAKTSLSEEDGITPTAIYWPVTKDEKLSGYHVKILGGGSFNIGDTRDCDLLNWSNAKKSGAYRLIITEGPEDMASVDRIYEAHGNKEYHPAVVSLPHGSASVKKTLTKHLKDLKLFKEVVFCFDDDEAGRLAVQNGKMILPEAKSVVLPTKDANQALVEGKAKAAYNALAFGAVEPKNTRIVFAEAIHESAKVPAEFGEFSWPFPTMNDLLRGMRSKETIYLGAGVKMGKTELRDEIAAHLIKKHKAKIFMACPEQTNARTYKGIAGKLSNKMFHDPKIEFDSKAFDEAGEIIRDKVAFVNVYQHLSWPNLKQDMIEAANWGAKVFFIDPITNLTNGINSGEANTALQEIAQDCAAFSMDMDITTLMFCHLKAPEGNISADQRAAKYKVGKTIGLGNCPHELGGDVMSSQFAGSRAMMRSANLMIGLEGNKDPDLDEETRNIRHVRILEDREFGVSERIPIFWDKRTGRFSEL